MLLETYFSRKWPELPTVGRVQHFSQFSSDDQLAEKENAFNVSYKHEVCGRLQTDTRWLCEMLDRVNFQTCPAYTEEQDGGVISQLVSKLSKIEPTKCEATQSESSQRCNDFAWRRLVVRHSAPRRLNMFQYRFYTRVAITKNIVYTVRRYEWIQVVKGIQTPTRCQCDGNDYL